jgi:hypothetical protein
MPRTKDGVNKSEEIRQVLKANPKIKVNEVVAQLKAQGITVKEQLVYYVKGRMKGRRGRKKRARQMVAQVSAMGNSDPVATILKLRKWAEELGGMKKLKALVDALSG